MRNIFLDWHGVLCPYDRMRSSYRTHLFAILQPLIHLSSDEWEKIEQHAYEKFLEVYNSALEKSEEEIHYAEVLRSADEIYYYTILSRLNLLPHFAGEPFSSLARRWEHQIHSSSSCVPPENYQYLYQLRDAGYTLFLVTSSSNAHIHGTLQGSGLQNFFHGVFSAESLDAFKVHKKFWQKVFALSGKSPETCLVADDTEANLIPPASFGALTALVSPTPPSSNTCLHFPDFSLFARWLLQQNPPE
ncbi:MAG: HAD family hydrolase [bacterium JZ-2024 1]